MSSQRLNNRLPALRNGDPTLARTQDSLRQVLTPALTPVLNSPIVGNDAPAWITPDFANANWLSPPTVGTVTLFSVQFHKDALGYVHIKGAVKTLVARAVASSLFTLPAGYGPKETHLQPVYNVTAGASAVITIAPTGIILAPVLANNDVFSLGDIVFLAEGGGTGGMGPAASHGGISPHG